MPFRQQHQASAASKTPPMALDRAKRYDPALGVQRALTMRPVLFLSLLVLSFLSACGGDRTSSAWQPYLDAEAVPGQGLGDLRLGSERMGNMIDQFGVERVGGWFSDEDNGIELIYGSVGLHFMFPLQGDCAEATRALGHRIVREMHQADDFLARYPACRELRLNAILITSTPRSAWWQGSTHRGSRMGDLWPEVIARHPGALQRSEAYLPQAHQTGLESLFFSDGMELYFRTLGSGPAGEVDRLLMPLAFVRLFDRDSD